jgi:hypothetical protein
MGQAMSDPAGVGADRSPPAVTSGWVQAIVTSALVGFVMGGIAYAVRQVFGLTSPDAGFVATLLLFATEIVTAVPSFAVYANRTGVILRRKLPAFPTLTWYALHVLIGVAVGTLVAYVERGSEPAPYEPPARSVAMSLAFGGVLAGAIIGAAVGGLQALVLRKAARSVGRWIGFSALGGTAFGLFAFALYIPGDHGIASEMLTLGLGAVIAVAAGLALLPAVHRLQPH